MHKKKRLMSDQAFFLCWQKTYSICGLGATPPPAAVAVRKVGVFMLSR